MFVAGGRHLLRAVVNNNNGGKNKEEKYPLYSNTQV